MNEATSDVTTAVRWCLCGLSAGCLFVTWSRRRWWVCVLPMAACVVHMFCTFSKATELVISLCEALGFPGAAPELLRIAAPAHKRADILLGMVATWLVYATACLRRPAKAVQVAEQTRMPTRDVPSSPSPALVRTEHPCQSHIMRSQNARAPASTRIACHGITFNGPMHGNVSYTVHNRHAGLSTTDIPDGDIYSDIDN